MNQDTQHPLRRLLSVASGYRSRVRLAVIVSIINKLFDLAPPVLIGVAVDVVVAQKESFIAGFGVEDLSLQLWVLAAFTLFVWVFESFTDYIASLLWRNIAQSIQHELRIDTFAKLQSLELGYFEDRNTGDLIAILNDDVNQLERFLDTGAHELIILVTTILVVGALFVGIVPEIAWMALLPMPFIAIGSLFFQKSIAPRYRAVRDQAGLVNSQLSNTLGGIATVKSFTSEDYEYERLSRLSDQYREKNGTAIKLSSAFVPIIRMVIVVGFTAILVYGGEMVIAGTLKVGAYSILVYMTQRLLWPLTRLGTTLDLYQRAMASTNRVLDVLQTRPKIEDGNSSLPLAGVRGEVEFEDVSFSYPKSPEVLSNISFKVLPGQTVGFVGSTGSGKTTLVKLLLRFYDASKGTVKFDGIDVRDLRSADLRAAIGLVSQDVFLVDGTVRENISYGSFGASDKQIVAAAQIAEADDFIKDLANGYDTVVGERGQKLSGGQRQRIAIARAVLKNSPVFILDEATSSVDNETEAAIQRAMYRIAADRTMLVIAHRLSTVRHADVIFVLDKGKIVETGTHEQLLQRDAVYATLWKVQTGEIRKVA